jgi:hypothetical protein
MRRTVRLRWLPVLALCLVPGLARADDTYPTVPDDQDYLCEMIARSSKSLVPPGDRAWFERTCTCSAEGICGRAGSKRYAARMRSGPADQQLKREAAIREQAWRRSAIQATEGLRRAYRACRAAGNNCEVQMTALEEGCNLVGLVTWDECLARE